MQVQATVVSGSMKLRPFLLLVFLAIFNGSNAHMVYASEKTEESPELKILAEAKSFDDGVAGERPGNGQSPLYGAFQKMLSYEKPVSVAVLLEQEKKATAAGRLYIAALIRELDSRAGIPALMQLYNDPTRVKYVSGCESMEYSVGEIAKHLLEDGKFQNFRLRVRCKT